jgi:FkbM family methyltransferase
VAPDHRLAQGTLVPKDDTHFPAAQPAAPRPGLVPRFLSWLFATGGKQARHAMHGTHEELFRMRGELAVLRGEIEAIHAAVGRRDIATVDELLRGGNRRQVEALIRDRVQTVPLPDGSVLCRALGRFKMFTDAADGGIAPHLLLDGYWEYWVTEFVCRNVARGETAMDVGAVYGYYTILLADLVGPGGRVVALEPNPWLHWLLRRNVVVNGLESIVTTHRVAATEAARESLRVPALLVGPANGPFAGRFSTESGRPGFSVPGAALQDLEPGSVDFLRVGCAASADVIVAGLGGLLDRSPNLRILLEFDAGRCAEPGALIAALAARYPLRFIDGDSRAKPCTAEDLLGQRRVATLFLSKVEPC